MKNLFKFSALLCMLFVFGSMTAQDSITGVWKTIDDNDGEEKSYIEITERDGKYYGTIIKLLPGAKLEICKDCPDGLDGKPLVGLEILKDLKPYKDYFSYGTIMDPDGGSIYKCNVTRDGDILRVKGYIGFSFIGREQQWYLVSE